MSSSHDALKAEGTKALGEGKVPEALALYLEALDVAPDDTARGALHSNISLCHLRLGDLDASVAAADACVSCRPAWEKGHFRAAEAHFAARRYDDAASSYAAAAERKPEDAAIAHRLALAREAASGFYFRQLLPGRDIAVTPRDAVEAQVFAAAKQMRNFVYLFGDARTRECVVVDACWDARGILAFAERDKMTVVSAVATHYHFDHVGGVPPPPFDAMGIKVPGLRDFVVGRGLPAVCHAEDAAAIAKACDLSPADANNLDVVSGDRGDLVRVGDVRATFLHTPGHSPGSLVVCIDGEQRGAPGNGAGVVISGDTIFPGSCGRLDLPDASVERMFDSLARCARELRDDAVVYPGHDYNGASSTVAREKREGMLRPFTKTQWMAMHAR